jgi:hypothetical protein
MATARRGWFAVVAVVVAWLWTVRSRVSKMVRTVVSKRGWHQTKQQGSQHWKHHGWHQSWHFTKHVGWHQAKQPTQQVRQHLTQHHAKHFAQQGRSTEPLVPLRGNSCLVQNGLPVANLGRTLHRISGVKTSATLRIIPGRISSSFQPPDTGSGPSKNLQKFLKKIWQGFQKFLAKTSKKDEKQNRLTALDVRRAI